jgi:glucose/arabinose dehydrogenase
MMPSVWNSAAAAMLALVLVAQTVTTQACPKDPPATDDPFTTSDGVRFRVDTVLSGIEGVPWAMEFAPDGRLFVSERFGVVLIVNVTAGTFVTALTLDGVFVAEVGVGVVHPAEAAPRRQADAIQRDLHRRIKDAFDPNHRLNPGYDPLAL